MIGGAINRHGWNRPAGMQRAFTLLELMMSVAVVGLALTIALPTYRSIVMRQKISQCARDLVTIAGELEKYRTLHFELPDDLEQLPGVPRIDPWGFDYRFLNFQSGIKGQIRKDHNLHPLNSEFDLYSIGPDGRSFAPLTASASRDDVIWARDGGFVGVAEDY